MIKLFFNAVLFYDQGFKVVFLGFLNHFKIKQAESSLNTLYCVLALLDLMLEHLAHNLAFAFERLAYRSVAAVCSTCCVTIEHQLALLLHGARLLAEVVPRLSVNAYLVGDPLALCLV